MGMYQPSWGYAARRPVYISSKTASLAPYVMPAGVGVYTLTGIAVTLTEAAPSGYTIYTVQPGDANTTSGQSIFAGLTIAANSKVILPNLVSGIVATWETQNGNATGRVNLASSISGSPATLAISFLNGSTQDTLNVQIVDQSGVSTYTLVASAGQYVLTGVAASVKRGLNLPAGVGAYTLSGQAVAYKRTYTVAAGVGVYTLNGQPVQFIAPGVGQPGTVIKSVTRNVCRNVTRNAA